MRPQAALLAGLALAAPAAAQERDPAQRLAESVLARTHEEQGGASHASGQRPELGPPQVRSFLLGEARTLRVGLTPTAFEPSGGVRLEYDAAAAHEHERVEITATGPFSILDPATGATLAAAGAGEAFVFARRGAGLALAGPGNPPGEHPGPLRARPAGPDVLLVVSSMRRLNRLLPPVDGSFPLTAPPYRGELEVFGSEASPLRLRLVNVVEIEPYVAGVVVNESLSSFHVEALKAQAVAARGYALANLGRFAARGFDLDDSTSSQVYRGQSSETATALEAAFATEGLVAVRDGRILSALYSSSMGGHTESNEYVFPSGGYPGTNPDPALRAVHDSQDPLSFDLSTESGVLGFYGAVLPGAFELSPATGAPLSSLHRWTRSRTAAELLARLKDPSRGWGVPGSAGVIQDIETTLRGSSGRAMQVVVSGDWGRTTISGWSDLRALATLAGTTPGGTSAASAPNSPSAFTITRDAAGRAASVTFVGGGFGHNVGMSQYGAQGRALRGQDFSQILAGYYTGVELATAPVALRAGAPPIQAALVADRATLVVENHGLDALQVEAGGRALLVPLRREEDREVDLGPLLGPAPARLRLLPRGGEGGAVVFVRRERLDERRGRR